MAWTYYDVHLAIRKYNELRTAANQTNIPKNFTEFNGDHFELLH